MAIVAYSLVSGILDEVLHLLLGQSGLSVFLQGVVRLVVDMFLGMGMTAFFIKAHDAVERVQLKDLWHPKSFWKYLGVSILVGVIVSIGFILVIIPGIIAMTMLIFASYLVIDRDLGPIAAIKESMRITKGHRWGLLGLILLAIVINILGAICLVVGIFVTIPVSTLAVIHAYRTLSQQKSGEAVPVA